MTASDWTQVVGAAGVFTLVTVIVSIAIVQLSATARAKAKLAREAEYRELAESAIHTEQAIERQLAEIAEQSAQTQRRLSIIERILADVE